MLAEPKVITFRTRRTRDETYSSLLEASAAVQKLDIRTVSEYSKRYHEDPMLPSNPNLYYEIDWAGWQSYLGTEPYKTLKEASLAAIKIGALSSASYAKKYKHDPRLVSNPSKYYSETWGGWGVFLGRPTSAPKTHTTRKFYETLEQAAQAARPLGAKTSREYKKLRKSDPMLHSCPNTYYRDEWVSWSDFLHHQQEKIAA